MGAIAQQIRVRSVGEDFAFVAIVAGGWSVAGIRIRRGKVEWPFSESNGKRYPTATPPPDIRDELEAEIVEAYVRATAG